MDLEKKNEDKNKINEDNYGKHSTVEQEAGEQEAGEQETGNPETGEQRTREPETGKQEAEAQGTREELASPVQSEPALTAPVQNTGEPEIEKGPSKADLIFSKFMKNKKGREKRSGIWQKKAKEQFLSLVFFLVLILVVVNSLVLYFRIDMTENNIYSISKVSVNALKEVEDLVYVDYYVSPKLKIQVDQTQQVLDILQEISLRSGGNIVIAEIDPETIEEQELQQKGLEARQMQFIEKNEASFAVVYSGIVISYQERSTVIPFTLQSSIIEYQIVSKILEVYKDDKRVIGLLHLDTAYIGNNDSVIQQVLSQDFEVEIVPSSGVPFSEELDVLFVIGNQEISNDAAYRIDQFIMQGKGVFFAVDRARVDLNNNITATRLDTQLNEMIEHYGLTIEPKIVLDALNKQLPTTRGPNIRMYQSYPPWPTVSQENVASDHPITNRFGGLDFYWTSPITAKAEANEYITHIVKSTKDAWSIGPTLGEGKIYPTLPDGTGFLSYRSENNKKQYNLISAYNGPLSSAVEAGIVSKPEENSDDYLASTETARFLVAGSSLFIGGSLYQITQANYNFSFISNTSDWLSSDLELLQIKSKAVRNYQLNKIKDETKKETYMFVVQLINTFIIPLLIIIVGFVVLLMRKNLSRRRY